MVAAESGSFLQSVRPSYGELSLNNRALEDMLSDFCEAIWNFGIYLANVTAKAKVLLRRDSTLTKASAIQMAVETNAISFDDLTLRDHAGPLAILETALSAPWPEDMQPAYDNFEANTGGKRSMASAGNSGRGSSSKRPRSENNQSKLRSSLNSDNQRGSNRLASVARKEVDKRAAESRSREPASAEGSI